MKRIIVYGASGHAKVLIDILERMSDYTVAGLIDDDARSRDREVFGYRVFGGGEAMRQVKALGVVGGIVGIGDNRIRRALATKMLEHDLELINAVHPSACISRGVHLGVGCALMANSVLNADSSLGDNVIVNTGATVDHDNVIGNCVHLSPGVHVAGGVRIGSNSHLGTGVTVIPNISIGENVSVSAGSVVTKDLPNGTIAAGAPARVISGNRE